jgi:hypothetical protein
MRRPADLLAKIDRRKRSPWVGRSPSARGTPARLRLDTGARRRLADRYTVSRGLA